jgi:hypothetical protein
MGLLDFFNSIFSTKPAPKQQRKKKPTPKPTRHAPKHKGHINIKTQRDPVVRHVYAKYPWVELPVKVKKL